MPIICHLGTSGTSCSLRTRKAKLKDFGEIRLGVSLSQKSTSINGTSVVYHSFSDELSSSSNRSTELTREMPVLSSTEKVDLSSVFSVGDSGHLEESKFDAPKFVDRVFQFFTRRDAEATVSKSDIDITEDLHRTKMDPEACENKTDDDASGMAFDKLLR